MSAPVARPGGGPRATLAALLAVAAAGCVTTIEDDGAGPYSVDATGPVAQGYDGALAAPVAIPFPELGRSEGRVLVEFYSGVLRRLQEAAAEGDVAMLDALVAQYDRGDVPDAMREHLQGYRARARGIAFQQHVARRSELRLRRPARPPAATAPAATPALGEPLQLELVVPPMDRPVRLGAQGSQDPLGFSVSITIEDEFVDGSSTSSNTDSFVWLPTAVELAGDTVLELPIDVAADPGGAVRRTVIVRVDLMPGYVQLEDLRAPVQRTTVGAGIWAQWPKGHDVIARQPIRALRAALADFQPNNYASAYVAALLVPDELRDEACELLIDQVRHGRADQAQVAMAALQKVAGVNIAVGWRDGWLEWWQAQQARRGR